MGSGGGGGYVAVWSVEWLVGLDYSGNFLCAGTKVLDVESFRGRVKDFISGGVDCVLDKYKCDMVLGEEPAEVFIKAFMKLSKENIPNEKYVYIYCVEPDVLERLIICDWYGGSSSGGVGGYYWFLAALMARIGMLYCMVIPIEAFDVEKFKKCVSEFGVYDDARGGYAVGSGGGVVRSLGSWLSSMFGGSYLCVVVS